MLVDDEPAQLRLISAQCQRAGWRTVTAASADMALARLAARDGSNLDAILIDSATGNVAQLISAMRARRRSVPIVLLTAIESVELAVAAIRAGATDYLVKPIAPERLVAALTSAVRHGSEGGELRLLTEKLPAGFGFDGIVGANEEFRAALAVAAHAADADTPLLIEGEPGVGKQLLAHSVHAASKRATQVFSVINCGTVPVNSLESTLFGHEAGAFPGAFARLMGRVSAADGGTLFLDQVECLPPAVQERLLHLLQHGEALPIGGRAEQVDVRVIAATDAPLEQSVRQGKFSSELFDLLADISVTVPPLRERAYDIPALVRHLLDRIAEQPGLRPFGITETALKLLQAYEWPGNVRQLQAALFRACVLSDNDDLDVLDFPQIAGSPGGGNSATVTLTVPLFDAQGNMRPLDAIEADVIRMAIAHYRGRMSEVARRLGIGRSTLYRKLAELGISAAA